MTRIARDGKNADDPRRCRVRPVGKAHAYPAPRPTAAWGDGEGEGPWLEVEIGPSPVALRAPATPRVGAGRDGRHRRGAVFMSGYTRKAAGYAVGFLKSRKFLGSSHVLPAQTVRISGSLGPDMVLPKIKRPGKARRQLATGSTSSSKATAAPFGPPWWPSCPTTKSARSGCRSRGPRLVWKDEEVVARARGRPT